MRAPEALGWARRIYQCRHRRCKTSTQGARPVSSASVAVTAHTERGEDGRGGHLGGQEIRTCQAASVGSGGQQRSTQTQKTQNDHTQCSSRVFGVCAGRCRQGGRPDGLAISSSGKRRPRRHETSTRGAHFMSLASTLVAVGRERGHLSRKWPSTTPGGPGGQWASVWGGQWDLVTSCP
jgi:hypothetical protein